MDKAFFGNLRAKKGIFMSLYDDKGFEEIKDIVSLYKQTYADRFGEDPDASLLKQKLQDLIIEKKERHFRSVFESMSTNNIFMAMDAFDGKLAADDADAVRNSGQNKVGDSHYQLQTKPTKSKSKKSKAD